MNPIPGLGRSTEKEMATYSSLLAWEVPQAEKPAGLQPVGSQRAGHDWAAKQQQMVQAMRTVNEERFCGNKRKTKINGWNWLQNPFFSPFFSSSLLSSFLLNPEYSQFRFLNIELKISLGSSVKMAAGNVMVMVIPQRGPWKMQRSGEFLSGARCWGDKSSEVMSSRPVQYAGLWEKDILDLSDAKTRR